MTCVLKVCTHSQNDIPLSVEKFFLGTLDILEAFQKGKTHHVPKWHLPVSLFDLRELNVCIFKAECERTVYLLLGNGL